MKLSRIRLNLRKVLVGVVLTSCFLMFMRTLAVGPNGSSINTPQHSKVPKIHVGSLVSRVQERDGQVKLGGGRQAVKFQENERDSRALQAYRNGDSDIKELAGSRDLEHGHYIVDNVVEERINEHLHQGHSDVGFGKKKGISKANNSSNSSCLEWVKRAPKPPYFLTAVLLVRIYEEDKAKLTTKEIMMWFQYLRYAGVEHVYVYDAWVHEGESQLPKLKAFKDDGYITYVDWHTHNPYTIGGTQVAAYQDCINQFAHENHWQAAIDIDEYPFSLKDTTPGFLYRYVKDFSDYHPQVSEITMHNYLYLGKPLEKELMIERLFRRTHQPANPLVKPIYKPSDVHAQVHHNSLRKGRSMNAPSTELRMNHYWGARLQNWGEDTPEVLARTEPDYSIKPIIRAFKMCESYVRPYIE